MDIKCKQTEIKQMSVSGSETHKNKVFVLHMDNNKRVSSGGWHLFKKNGEQQLEWFVRLTVSAD